MEAVKAKAGAAAFVPKTKVGAATFAWRLRFWSDLLPEEGEPVACAMFTSEDAAA